jgi:hypothetical protein
VKEVGKAVPLLIEAAGSRVGSVFPPKVH